MNNFITKVNGFLLGHPKLLKAFYVGVATFLAWATYEVGEVSGRVEAYTDCTNQLIRLKDEIKNKEETDD